MKNNQRGYGIVISYINIIFSTCVNIFLTPLLIATLSDEGYSIYKIMRSFSGPLIMLNLGVSTVVARCVAKYRLCDDGDKREKENMLAIATILSGLMAATVLVVSYIIKFSIPSIYGSTFSLENIKLAQTLFMVFATTTAVHIFSEGFRGCIIGHERFIFYYGSKTIQYVFRFTTIFILLRLNFEALSIAMVDLIIAIIILIAYIIYVFGVLHEKVKLYYIDKKELAQFGTFAAAILLQAVINQVNNNLDIVIMGAVINSAEIITMYSSALTIYSVYNMLISVFSGVYLSQAAQLVTQKASGKQLTDFVIKPGRIQAMVAVGIVCGFALTGKDFIDVWIGNQYANAYYVALFLMIPVTIPLVESVCISILDAKLKRIYRSITLLIMAIVNLILTLILVPLLGFWGALLGTVISFVVGDIIMMNIYYQKSLGLNVIRMFKEIFYRTFKNGLMATVLGWPLSFVFKGSLCAFFIKSLFFIIIYGLLMYYRGFNDTEKQYVMRIFRKILKKQQSSK